MNKMLWLHNQFGRDGTLTVCHYFRAAQKVWIFYSQISFYSTSSADSAFKLTRISYIRVSIGYGRMSSACMAEQSESDDIFVCGVKAKELMIDNRVISFALPIPLEK